MAVPVGETPWERRTRWPLAGLALLFLAAYAVPVLDPDAPRSLVAACRTAVAVTWACFGIDYLVRLAQAEHRARWVRRNLIDAVVLVVPFFRPLQALRLVSVLRVINRPTASGLRGRVGTYLAGAALLLGFTAAVAVLGAERGVPGATITTFEDAVWWACATMSTVGYGDVYPVTGTGRLIGVALMVSGIAILGTVTATLASWILDSVRAETDEALDDANERLHDEVAALRREIGDLARRLEQHRG